MVTNIYVKFNYHRLRIDKALGNFPKSDNNKNNSKNNVRSVWGPLLGSKCLCLLQLDVVFPQRNTGCRPLQTLTTPLLFTVALWMDDLRPHVMEGSQLQ